MSAFIATWESQFYLFHKNSLLFNTIIGSISWQFCSKTLVLLIYCFLWDLLAYIERFSWHIQFFLVDTVGTFSLGSLFIKTWLHLSGNVWYPCFSVPAPQMASPVSLGTRICTDGLVLLDPWFTPHSSPTGPGLPWGRSSPMEQRLYSLTLAQNKAEFWGICGFELELFLKMALFTLKLKVLPECSCGNSRSAFPLSTSHLAFSQEDPVIVKHRAYSQLQ